MSESSKVPLSKQQLEALDKLIKRGKPISTEEMPGGSRGPGKPRPECWLDTIESVVDAVAAVTEVAGCAGAAYKPEVNSGTGEKHFTLAQLKDLRSRATQK